MKKHLLAMTFLLAMMLSSCSSEPNKSIGTNDPNKAFQREDLLMGTIITQKIYGQNAEDAGKKVIERFSEIENKMTINESGGEVNSINEMAGRDPVRISSDTFSVIKDALKYSELSSGAFDITIGPIVKSWGIFTDSPRVPSREEINNLLQLVNYKDVEIDEKNLTVKLRKKDQIIDLGGIAKGYAGDEAIRIYKQYDIKSAFVNLGGNVVALGSKPDGSDWKIGIRNPRDESGAILGYVNVKDKAIVTSGDYERFFEENGVTYHHILDTNTGYPADSGLISVSIIADISMDADALSTSVFVLGLDKGRELIESIEGIEGILITSDKKIFVTDGLKNSFVFDDKSKEYEYVEKR